MRWWLRCQALVTGVAGGEQRSRSGDGAAAELLRPRCASGGRRERDARQSRGNGLGARAGVPTRGVGGRPRRAPRRRTAATWPSLAGTGRAPRAGERGGGGAGRAARWAEREAGLAQQRLPLFYFFLISFLQIHSKFIWTNLKPFSPLAPKNKVVPK